MVQEILLQINQHLKLQKAVLSRLKNRRFWRNSGLLLLANVIVIAFGIIRTPAITWMLPKNEVGMIGVVASWLPFLQLLSLSGLDGASYHYVAKGQPWAFRVNLEHRLRWSLLSSAGYLVGAVLWARSGDGTLAWMFVIAGISYPVTIGLSATSGMLGAQERYKGLFWFRIFESLTDFAGFIPLLLSVWWVSQVVTFYASNQIATTIMLVGLSVLFWLELKRYHEPMPLQDQKEMVSYGKHLTVMNGFGVLQTRTDSLIVGALLPLGVMADFSIALLVYEQMRRLWNVYVTVRYPPLVKLPILHRQRRVFLEGAAALLLFLGMAIGISLLSHTFIPIVLPPSYLSSLKYIDWLIFAFVFSVPGFMAEIYFRTQQDERHLYMLRGAAAVIGSVTPAILITTIGVNGIAIGRFLSAGILSAFGLYLFRGEYVRAHASDEATKTIVEERDQV